MPTTMKMRPSYEKLEYIFSLAHKNGWERNIVYDEKLDQFCEIYSDGGHFVPSIFALLFDVDFLRSISTIAVSPMPARTASLIGFIKENAIREVASHLLDTHLAGGDIVETLYNLVR